MSSNTNDITDDLGNRKVDLPDGSALFALPHDPSLAAKSIERDIGQKTDTGPAATPDPTADDESQTLDPHQDGGPLRRFTNIKSPLGMVGLESLAKDEDELADAIRKRADEIYRNEFPVIVPKFGARCEQCGAEFDDEELSECRECGADTLTTPDPEEQRELKDLFASVNKEGQSMRQLGRITDADHSRLGVMCWVLRWTYVTGPREVSTSISSRRQVVARNFDELVRGDPKRIVPVADEHGRVGGVWWTCPIHRQQAVVNAEEFHADGVTHCPECGCGLREVHYVELEGAAGKRPEKFFFEHEIVMHAGHIPQAHGLDGLSPVHLVWLEQAILHWMDVYAAEFFNPHSERTPNKFLIVHTANPESFEAQLDEAKDEAAQNPYKSGIFYNQVHPDQSASTEAQVIDVMGDEFLGQSEELRKRFENHIRTVFGVTDVFDSELEDAGGLNNEGLQLEVTDRSIAAAQQDYSDGPYEELLRHLGYEDWLVKFVPARETDLQEQREAVRLLREAAEIGLPARMENGEPVIGDGEAEAPQQPAPGGPGDDPDATPTDESLEGDPDEMRVPPPDRDGEEGNAMADDLGEAIATFRAGFEDIVWADPADAGQKAQPIFADDDDVPANVETRIREAAQRVSWSDTDGAPARPLRELFVAKLSQPQGWSIDSLTRALRQRFDIEDPDRRENIARTKSAQVLNAAKAQAFADLEAGVDEPVLYFWTGPLDGDTTGACRELQEATDPDHGGTPRPLDEFLELKQDVAREHFPEFDDGHDVGDPIHWQERHAIEAVLPQQVGQDPSTARPGAVRPAAADD